MTYSNIKHYSFALAITTVLLLASTTVSAEDQIDLKGMSIIGNNELPKALIIVPWKEAESPLTPERPLNSLINDILQPIDPDVFRRQLQYFDQLHNSKLKTRDADHDNN